MNPPTQLIYANKNALKKKKGKSGASASHL
jgi:hypothetical protein